MEFVYCEKCGRIYFSSSDGNGNIKKGQVCDVCGTIMKAIPEGYDMSVDTWLNQRDIWNSNRERLYEEVIKISPGYDPNLFEQRDDILAEKEKNRKKYIFKDDKNKNNIKCPYCGSYLVKKIGAGSRLLSVGLLGFGSSKIGKQWHCENCKSDF